MATNNESEFYASLFRGPMDNVLDVLSMLNLIDIGLIIEVDGEGRATVQTSKTSSNIPILLTNVEIVYPGNNNGAFTSSCAGCMGLIFAPRTIIPDIRDGKINATLPEYNISGIKVLPISNGRKLSVNHCFDADGSLHIYTEKYSFDFDVGGFDFNSVAGMFLTVSKDNTVTLYRRNKDSGILDFKLSNEGITSKFTNTKATSIYAIDMLDTGVLSLSHLQPQKNDDPKSLNSVVIGDDGQLTLTAGTNDEGKPITTLSVGTDGSIGTEVKGEDATTTLSVDAKGAVTVEVKGGDTSTTVTVTIGTDGSVNIDAGGDVTLKSGGDMSLEASGDLSLKGANIKASSTGAGGTVNINNGNLEVS